MRQRTIFRHPAGSHRSRRVRAGARRRGEPGGRRSLRLPGRPQPGDPMPDRRQGLRQTFYDLGFLIWYSYLSLPAGLVLFGVWVVVAIIAFVVIKRRQHRPPSEPPSPGKSFLRGALIVIALALSPIAVTYSAGFIASLLGCDLNEASVHPCPLLGVNVGPLLYAMGLAVWFVASRLRRAWSRFSCLRSSGSRAP